MAEQNQMSSELSSIDPLALSWVEYWHPIAWKGLLIGCSIAVVAAVVSVGSYCSYCARLTCAISCPIGALRRSKSKLEQPKQTCSAQKQIFQGRRLGWLRRSAEATHANQTITALEVNAAKANERIATLEKEAAVSKSALAGAEARVGGAQAEARHATETISELRADVAKSQEHIAA